MGDPTPFSFIYILSRVYVIFRFIEIKMRNKNMNKYISALGENGRNFYGKFQFYPYNYVSLFDGSTLFGKKILPCFAPFKVNSLKHFSLLYSHDGPRKLVQHPAKKVRLTWDHYIGKKIAIRVR